MTNISFYQIFINICTLKLETAFTYREWFKEADVLNENYDTRMESGQRALSALKQEALLKKESTLLSFIKVSCQNSN